MRFLTAAVAWVAIAILVEAHQDFTCGHGSPRLQRRLHSGMDQAVPVTSETFRRRQVATDRTVEHGSILGHTGCEQPLRITFSYLDVEDTTRSCRRVGQMVYDYLDGAVNCSTEEDVLTPEKENTLKTVLLPRASALLSAVLGVDRRNTPLKAMRDSVSYDVKIPQSHITTGVDTDRIIYVVSAPAANPGVYAWAYPCQFELGMPQLGVVNLPSRNIPTGATLNDATVLEFGTRILVHELLHALGFATLVFDGSAGHPLALSIGTVVTADKPRTPVVTTPRCQQVVRDHFNCPTAPGIELENEGPEGSLGSHLESRFNPDDLMGADGGRLRLTNATLAVMFDLGFAINKAALEHWHWGANAGCPIINGSCHDPSLAQHFCSCPDGEEACTTSGVCSSDWSSRDYCSEASPFTNNCSFYRPEQRCRLGLRCFRNVDQTANECLPIRCFASNGSYSFEFTGRDGLAWFNCPSGVNSITVAVTGGTLPIFCPPFSDICHPSAFDAPVPNFTSPSANPNFCSDTIGNDFSLLSKFYLPSLPSSSNSAWGFAEVAFGIIGGPTDETVARSLFDTARRRGLDVGIRRDFSYALQTSAPNILLRNATVQFDPERRYKVSVAFNYDLEDIVDGLNVSFIRARVNEAIGKRLDLSSRLLTNLNGDNAVELRWPTADHVEVGSGATARSMLNIVAMTLSTSLLLLTVLF